MKRTILASILGVAAMVATSSSYGQGKINLNNYSSTGQQIVYGAGIPGATAGNFILNGTPGGAATWTIGIYYAIGDVRASVIADPSGTAAPTGGGLTFATGAPGDTTTIKNNLTPGGYFTSTSDAIINGWTAGSVTFEVVAYSGADYASSAFRGHSAAFLASPIDAGAPQGAPQIATSSGGMPQFAVFSVPEPSIFALSGLGAAALMAFRRKK